MTPPGKSAALRVPLRSASADTGAAGFEAAVRNAAAARLRPRSADGARDKLVAFPGFEPSQPAAQASEAAPDLGGELEAALMSDLQSMVALFDEVARTPTEPAPQAPAASPPPAAALPPEASEPDQEALDRLLASIRQSDRDARRAAPAVPEPDLDHPDFPRGSFNEDDIGSEPIAYVPVAGSAVARSPATEAPMPKRNPNSPRPGGREDRLNSPLPRARKAAASPAAASRIASKSEPVPALRLPMPGARRAYVKPVIAVSLLILLATVGAGMTIRALTARNDTAPSEATAAPATAAPAAAVAAAEPAKVDDKPAATDTGSAPTTIAKIETQPMAATPEVEAPARAAVDNTAQHTVPAEMTQPTVMQVTPSLSPTAPLPSGETPSETPVADLAAMDPAPAAPTPSETVATPKPASVGGVSAGSVKPGAGRIASGVKLRTNPDNGAPVIAVLGQGTAVQIVSCKGWCEVVAGDKRGFVYQKFLSAAGG
ncbi:SH3 domain-containing protein [Kaistia soli DSM 19436]|uniref:SH3 domain-containing protein n=1 Tax=Kaistia soli DSM 19436 TaxID=1122133 RepID=A0A1M5D6Y1_9HYPH|nr:SH3 domain-containing protein [Kaistia soli]SHF62766.1 SH3 domain-containing protein [Kaistia soli DSM 19436]